MKVSRTLVTTNFKVKEQARRETDADLKVEGTNLSTVVPAK